MDQEQVFGASGARRIEPSFTRHLTGGIQKHAGGARVVEVKLGQRLPNIREIDRRVEFAGGPGNSDVAKLADRGRVGAEGKADAEGKRRRAPMLMPLPDINPSSLCC